MTRSQAIEAGFDRSITRGPYLVPKCSQCEVLVIQGIPCHEPCCPNARHECAGCNAQIPLRQRYCAECE